MPEEEVINSPEIFSDLDESITEEEITNDDLKSEEETEEFSVEQEISEEDFEEDPEEESEEDSEQNTEDGEFGGYKLGNVYKKKPKSLKEADPKNVPPELLITKGDPTRL